MTQSIDSPAIEAAVRGDAAALGRLLEAHQHRLYHVCLRMVGHREDAAEVAQETMLKIVEHIRDFQGQSDIGTWMVRIAMNQSISHLRKRKLRGTASLDATDAQDQSSALRAQLVDRREPPPDSGVQYREEVATLHAALAAIDDDFRAILVLRDIDGLEYQQIAVALGLPAGTVKSRLFRARLALRQEMLRLSPDLADGKAAALARVAGVHGFSVSRSMRSGAPTPSSASALRSTWRVASSNASLAAVSAASSTRKRSFA